MNIRNSIILIYLATMFFQVNAGEETLRSGTFVARYNTIHRLKLQVTNHLNHLDAEIVRLKASAEDSRNPFSERAKRNLKEAQLRRTEFLALTWKCPHAHWKKCTHCDGGKKTWRVGDGLFSSGPCKMCRRKNNFRVYVKAHPAPDKNLKCGITIGQLLRVK